MASNPKVSVVIPVYGVEKYLRQCVDSILTQTLDDIEVILVDDGSPDKCPQIIDEYARQDSRVVPVHQPNGGYGVAVNNGINATRGDYVGIIESDDWIEPTMYEKLYDNAVKNNSDVVKCSFYIYDSTQKPQHQNRKWETDYVDLFGAPEGAFVLADYPGIVMFHASVWASLYRADFVKDIKMLETRSASYQDFPFMCEVMSTAKRISVEKDYLVHYRMEPNQNSSTKQIGERSILMATQSINGIEILKTNGVLDLVKEEIYWHAYTASIEFFRGISWQFKKKFFDELHRLFVPLAGTDFKFKHFPEKAIPVARAIMEGNYPKTIFRLYDVRRMLIQIHIPNGIVFKSDHFRIILLGVQIAEKDNLALAIPSWKRIEIGVGGIMRGILATIVSLFIPFRATRRRVRRLIRGDTKYEEMNTKAWRMYTNGDDRRALARFCAKNDTRMAWKHCPHDFWLMWTSALYELGDKVGAAEVIKRYAEKYGTFDIFRYVLAAKCAFENGITSPEIEQAVYEEINTEAWWMYLNGDDRRVLARFCAKNDTQTVWKYCLHDFWLVWTSALCELGDNAAAAEVIKRYAEKYGTFDIFRYVLAAKCAFENGIISPEIEQAVYVWDHFQESRRAKLIEKMVDGKRVAIIGNGPQAVDKRKDAEINAADVVIRFNGFQTAGYEEDYGTRTDIWVWGAGEGEVEENKIPNCKVMVWVPGYEHFKIIDDYLDVLYRNIKANYGTFDYLPVENMRQLLQEIPIMKTAKKTPTTGTQFLHYVAKYTNPAQLDFYGFSFMNDAPVESYTHYYPDQEEFLSNSERFHDIRGENEYLRALFAKKGKK
jgi:glycosyltransferase involved in cell wall biosynthesis